MDSSIWVALIAGTVSLLVSSVVSFWMQRKKLESDYDIALRQERIVEYRKLWQLTEPLGWYGKHELTPEVVQKLRVDIDHWYFEDGSGILLSEGSHSVFEELLKTLHDNRSQPKQLRLLGTKLRVALSSDVLGRRAPSLGSDLSKELLKWQKTMDQRPFT